MWKNNGAPRRRPEKRVFRDCALNHRDARLADVLARRSQAWCWDKRCDRLTCVAGGLSGGRAETLHEFPARVLAPAPAWSAAPAVAAWYAAYASVRYRRNRSCEDLAGLADQLESIHR